MAEATQAPDVVDTSPEVLREQAIRRVKKRRDFHAHAFAFVAVNLVLWGVWSVVGVTQDTWNPWPLWVTLLWGLVLTLNAWDVYGRRPITEEEVEREIDRLSRAG